MSKFDNQDEGIFDDIHRNHQRSRTTQAIGYIVYNDQADKIRCSMDAQARKGDALPLAMLAMQFIVLVIATVVALA